MDYVCPFSAKISLTIENVLRPLLGENGQYAGKVKIIFRNQVQPWHASSTFVHEAGLAVCRRSLFAATSFADKVTTQVARVAPEKFWQFSLAVSTCITLSVCLLMLGVGAPGTVSYSRPKETTLISPPRL